MLGKRVCIRIPELPQQSGGALDVGEEKCDGAARKIAHRTDHPASAELALLTLLLDPPRWALRRPQTVVGDTRLSMTRPFLLVQLSDPHIGATWAGGDPVARLSAAVESVRRLPDPLHAVLMSGDLADNAADGEYELVRELLAQLGAPVASRRSTRAYSITRRCGELLRAMSTAR